jgi:cell division protease FtsH
MFCAFAFFPATLSGKHGFCGAGGALQPARSRLVETPFPGTRARQGPSRVVSKDKLQSGYGVWMTSSLGRIGRLAQELMRDNMVNGTADLGRYRQEFLAIASEADLKDSKVSRTLQRFVAATFAAMIVLHGFEGGSGFPQPVQAAPMTTTTTTTTTKVDANRTAPATGERDTAPVPAGSARGAKEMNSRNVHVRYSEFWDMIVHDRIEKVTFSPDMQRALVIDTDGNRFRMDALPNDPDLLPTLTKHKVDIIVLPAQQDNGIGDFLRSLIFPALLFGGLYFLSRRFSRGVGPGGMGNPLELTRSQAKVQMVPKTGITFNDVAGCDGAKLELQEVVSFLKNSDAFTEVGAQVPRGVILEGPPGTGKTLLARAVAGEAGVPFFSISGSEFVEMFVGVGASRVRDLFSQAKKNAPCIVFIDEIDAVGRQRGAGIAGGNDEREQTLNQLLTEMDGFEGNSGVIVMAATNRSDVLDPALLRPGRFDRRITVDLPDLKGRLEILKVHSRNKPLAAGVDLEMVARRTPGFSGASLQNLMNEAAIFAARRDSKEISNEDIDNAIDRVLLGPAKRDAVMSERRKELVAYHEAGHALVGALTPGYDQPIKVTIIPRGSAGGVTFFAPNEVRAESGMYTRQFLESQLSVALGGRIAEEIIYGPSEATTGAANDLQQVSNIARRMVTQFGMSELLGPVALEQPSGNPFLGRDLGSRSLPSSAATRALIDAEVRRLVDRAYERAKTILTKNRHLLDKLARLLIEKETVSSEEIAMLIAQNNVVMADYAVL